MLFYGSEMHPSGFSISGLIEETEVIDAMEMAIAKAGRTKYGFELDIRAHVDKKTGRIGLFRYL